MSLSTPALFIFSGAPASGKTTLARRLAQRLHALYLRLGHDVVTDGVNDVNVTRDAWRDVALGAGAAAIEIEILCSDPDEHRRRVETRIIDIPGLRPPTWEEICAMRPDPWPRGRLAIETAGRSVENCFSELLARLLPLATGSES